LGGFGLVLLFWPADGPPKKSGGPSTRQLYNSKAAAGILTRERCGCQLCLQSIAVQKPVNASLASNAGSLILRQLRNGGRTGIAFMAVLRDSWECNELKFIKIHPRNPEYVRCSERKSDSPKAELVD
jgi:hypothetical protein